MTFTPRRVLAATAIAIAAAVTGAVPAAAHTPTVTVLCQYQVVGGQSIRVMSDHFMPRGGNDIRGWLSPGTLVTAGKDGTAMGDDYKWRQIVSYDPQPAWSQAQYLQRTSTPCFT